MSDKSKAAIEALDDLDWAVIYAAVAGPLADGVRSAYHKDAHAAQNRVFNKVHRVLTARGSNKSPLELRLALRPGWNAGPGERYGPEVGTCYVQGGPFQTSCGIPRPHEGADHSWESGMNLWRCEKGHVIEQVIGEPSECKVDRCPAEFFLPLSDLALHAWMQARYAEVIADLEAMKAVSGRG